MNNTFNIPHQNLAAQHVAMKEEILEAVSRVIDSGMFVGGDEVVEFEKQFAKLVGSEFAIGVNSGTDALVLALKVLNIGPGDEVITVPNSYVATGACIALVGATPVFVDVSDDYNIDPSKIEKAITKHTRAIIPVHLTGRPAHMDEIMAIAQKKGLHVIEDCAQAVCAEYKGQKVGTFGSFGCFSLHPLKTLNACGDGGVITTDDPQMNARLRSLRSGGLKNRDECAEWGQNSRLDTIQAAILLAKLNYVDEWTRGRQLNAEYYQLHLSDISQIQLPIPEEGLASVYHTFVIQADHRDELQNYLSAQGIGTLIHYPIPIHLQEAAQYLGYKKGSFPVVESQAKKILSLPVYPELGSDELGYIVNSLREFYTIGQSDAGSLLLSRPTI